MSMSPEDAEEYTQAVGQSVSGGYRIAALGIRLGVPKALGLLPNQWVEERLGGYVRMSIPERREAVKELDDEGMKRGQIAAALGVGKDTVRRDIDRAKAPSAPKRPSSEPGNGADAPPVQLDEDELAEQQIARDREEAIGRDANRIRAFLSGYDAAYSLALHIHSRRDDVLAVLHELDSKRFLRIESMTTWPESRP